MRLPRPILGAALAAAVALLAGCGRSSRVEMGARAQILYLGNGAEPADLDPNTQVSEIEFILDSSLFEPLVNIANDGATILPGVAERWELSPDQKTYTFHLRGDARWSDGSPVTAQDFAYSFRRIFTPSIGSENNVYGYAIAGAEALNAGRPARFGVTAVDARTLTVELDYPAPYFLYILGGAPFCPVPPRVVARFGGDLRPGTAWTRPENMVSNGPFVLAAWRPNQEIVVRRNPAYWDRARVRLQEVHFFPTDDVDAEERAFRAGQLHATFALPRGKLKAYREAHDPRLHLSPLLGSVFVEINAGLPPLQDARVRRALALAIDRERIVGTVSEGSVSPGHTLTRPGTAGFQPAAAEDYNPALARRLLREAGFPTGSAQPRLTLEYPAPMAPIAAALQRAWDQELGVHIDVETQEQKTLFQQMQARNYQLALIGYLYGVPAPETILMLAQSQCGWNNSGWISAAFDARYRDATYAASRRQREADYDAMESLIRENAPLIPLGFENQAFLVSPLLKGWRDNALQQIDWRELYLQPD